MSDMFDFDSEEADNSDEDECVTFNMTALFPDLNFTGGFDLDSLFGGLTTPPANSSTTSGGFLGLLNNGHPGNSNATSSDTTTTGSPFGGSLSDLFGGLFPDASNGTTPAFAFDLSLLGNISIPDSDIDESSYKKATDLLWQIVPPIVIVLGSIGNLLTIMVMFRQIRRSSTAVFLVALAISDIMILYCGPLREWILQLREVDVRHYSEAGCRASAYFTYTSIQMSSWLLVVVTVQRVVVVRWPHRRHMRCSPKAALVVLCVLIFVIYGLNVHFLYGMGNSALPRYLGRGKCHPLYESYLNFHDKVWPWVDFAVVFALPFVVLCACNVIIIYQVNKQRILRRRMSVGSERAGTVYEKDTRMITTMLILLSAVFFICTLPATIYFILRPHYNKKLDKLLCKQDFAGYLELLDVMTFWHSVTGCISYLNATLNFALYVMSGTKFRKEVVATLCCRSTSRRRSRSLKSGLSTIRSVSSSEMQTSSENRKRSRSSSNDVGGIERLLLKMKLRRQSQTTDAGRQNRHSIDTTISVIEDGIEPVTNDINHNNQNGLMLVRETPFVKKEMEIVHKKKPVKLTKKSDDGEMNMDPIGEKVEGIMDTHNLAITQLCVAMMNNSKPKKRRVKPITSTVESGNNQEIHKRVNGKRTFERCHSIAEKDGFIMGDMNAFGDPNSFCNITGELGMDPLNNDVNELDESYSCNNPGELGMDPLNSDANVFDEPYSYDNTPELGMDPLNDDAYEIGEPYSRDSTDELGMDPLNDEANVLDDPYSCDNPDELCMDPLNDEANVSDDPYSCNNTTELGMDHLNGDANEFGDPYSCDNTTEMGMDPLNDDANVFGDPYSCNNTTELDIDPLNSDVKDLVQEIEDDELMPPVMLSKLIGRGTSLNSYESDEMDEYVTAAVFDNKGVCTEYDLGFV